MDEVEQRLEEINGQITALQKTNRWLSYKMEDQENCSRQKNIRIRGIPEKFKSGELTKVMQDRFNPILGREAAEILKIDRVHRITRYHSQSDDTLRHVIVRLHYAEEKSKIMEGIRMSGGISGDGIKLQIFLDLSAETLARRRLLKPLTEQMHALDVTYQWGFQACLKGKKDGHSAVSRFPEDLTAFCNKLDLPPQALPGWEENNGQGAALGSLYWTRSRGRGV